MKDEEKFLAFLFEEMWNSQKDEMESWWEASLSEFVDIAPEELQPIDVKLAAKLMKDYILKGLRQRE